MQTFPEALVLLNQQVTVNTGGRVLDHGASRCRESLSPNVSIALLLASFSSKTTCVGHVLRTCPQSEFQEKNI